MASLSVAGCGEEKNPGEEVTIIYTGDIHGYIANEAEDSGQESDAQDKEGLRLSKIAELADDLEEEGKNVLLVDAGDIIQGGVYGSYDEGESVIELMNEAGYKLSTPGNHEFDYGLDQLFNLVNKAEFPFITCNMHSINEEDPFEDTEIFEVGDVKIAFVGISSPYTIAHSTPTNFTDENGDYIYCVDGDDGKEELYDSVQKAVDSVKNQVDYVIALGHV